MPTPDFILSLREKIGHDLLLLGGVAGVVRNSSGQVLLGRRSDTGSWALPSGILEPGEQPADGLAREIEEETCVVATVDSVVSVWTLPEVTYPNGDRSQYLDVCFLCSYVSGEAAVGDGELTEVAWFDPGDLPDDMGTGSRRKLALAMEHDGSAWFEGRQGVTRYAVSPRPAGPVPLATFGAGEHGVVLRRAAAGDVAAIVGLIADDQLGAAREDPGDLTAYLRAFAVIDSDPAQLLVVLEDDGVVVGTLQLSIIPGLSRGGSTRAQVEAVRVAATHRGQRLGEQLVRWAVEESRRRGCSLVQLTTDKSRTDAHRFYQRLGFTASHEGFKMVVTEQSSAPAEEPR